MYSPLWQIGLDIQSLSVRAIALQRRRYGWQLRHWWQHPLPVDTFHDESLHHPQYLIPIIRHWRNMLPRRFSLRIALPASLVLQYCLPPPAQSLDSEALQWYVTNQSIPLRSLGGQAVTLDYRLTRYEPRQLYVTAARQEELHRWLHCLAEVELVPQVVEITPCVLRLVAKASGVAPATLLLYRADSHLLWVSPWEQPLQFGVLPQSTIQVMNAARTAYYAVSGLNIDRVCYSSTDVSDVIADVEVLSPLMAIQQLQPPLPAHSAAYALAIGLALREEDTE